MRGWKNEFAFVVGCIKITKIYCDDVNAKNNFT